MPFLAVGVEHATAPLSVRERLALDSQAIATTSLDLIGFSAVEEVVILSTCNRTELYFFADDIDKAYELASLHLCKQETSAQPYIQRWSEMDAAQHLFRVASGLESQLLGETEILGQVREALDSAQRHGTIGPNLHSLFRSAISCARQARASTALGKVNLSLGSEAVRVAEEELGSLAGRSVLVIGGGEISRLVAVELQLRKPDTIYLANRTASVATELANRIGVQPALISDVPRLVPHVDLIFSATGARHYMLTTEDIPAAIAAERTLHIYDLAVPRDVDPEVGAIPGVVLHDLDSFLPAGLTAHWQDDITSIEAIIAAEVQEFQSWYLTRRIVPVITSLRSHVEAVSDQELRRVASQLANLSDRERAAVDSLTSRLIDKMFHHLVTRLRLAAQTDPSLVEAAEFFFLHGEGGLFEHAAGQKETELTQ